MNAADRNFVTFLAEALIGSKDLSQYKAVKGTIVVGSASVSPAFTTVVTIFDDAAKKILNPTRPEDRIPRAIEVVRNLSNDMNTIEQKSVGQAISWAVSNWKAAHAD